MIAGFGEEAADGQIDEYRVGFTLRQSPEVVYGIVWPLYGQEDEEGTPMEGPGAGGLLPAPLTPINEIIAHLNEAGVTHIKRINERMSPSIATTAARPCSPTLPASWCTRRCRKIRRRGPSTSTDGA